MKTLVTVSIAALTLALIASADAIARGEMQGTRTHGTPAEIIIGSPTLVSVELSR